MTVTSVGARCGGGDGAQRGPAPDTRTHLLRVRVRVQGELHSHHGGPAARRALNNGMLFVSVFKYIFKLSSFLSIHSLYAGFLLEYVRFWLIFQFCVLVWSLTMMVESCELLARDLQNTEEINLLARHLHI